MNRTASLLVLGFLFAGLAVSAQTAGSPKGTAPAQTAKQAPTEAERGERAFKAQCSRCHNAPETLNPRITGTIIRHMRVRANLSAADERNILHFLNP